MAEEGMKNCGPESWMEVPEDLGLASPQPSGDVLGSVCLMAGFHPLSRDSGSGAV